MMRRLAPIAALALPLAGLALLWGWSDWRSRQGTTWEVPVEGYDPRDLLRGHYVMYRYRWPALEGDVDNLTFGYAPSLCLEGQAPQIARVRTDQTGTCANRVRPEQGTGSLAGGRYYLPQTAAGGIERRLMDPDQQAILRFRLRNDGLIVPLDIRFRPKTAAERAAAESETQPAPPPVTVTPN
jgi:hypothetical protein